MAAVWVLLLQNLACERAPTATTANERVLLKICAVAKVKAVERHLLRRAWASPVELREAIARSAEVATDVAAEACSGERVIVKYPGVNEAVVAVATDRERQLWRADEDVAKQLAVFFELSFRESLQLMSETGSTLVLSTIRGCALHSDSETGVSAAAALVWGLTPTDSISNPFFQTDSLRSSIGSPDMESLASGGLPLGGCRGAWRDGDDNGGLAKRNEDLKAQLLNNDNETLANCLSAWANSQVDCGVLKDTNSDTSIDESTEEDESSQSTADPSAYSRHDEALGDFFAAVAELNSAQDGLYDAERVENALTTLYGDLSTVVDNIGNSGTEVSEIHLTGTVVEVGFSQNASVEVGTGGINASGGAEVSGSVERSEPTVVMSVKSPFERVKEGLEAVRLYQDKAQELAAAASRTASAQERYLRAHDAYARALDRAIALDPSLSDPLSPDGPEIERQLCPMMNVAGGRMPLLGSSVGEAMASEDQFHACICLHRPSMDPSCSKADREKARCLHNPSGPDDGPDPKCFRWLAKAPRPPKKDYCALARCPPGTTLLSTYDSATGAPEDCGCFTYEGAAAVMGSSNCCSLTNCGPGGLCVNVGMSCTCRGLATGTGLMIPKNDLRPRLPGALITPPKRRPNGLEDLDPAFRMRGVK